MSLAGSEAPLRRGLRSAAIMFSCMMVALDLTIANVSLPHMMGSVSASADQITWVLTSYIIASAIVTPVSGWLASRFGRKSVFLVCIGGFVASSVLCGLSASLTQIVAFRVMQGMFGAPIVPLAQAELLDMNPPERQGQAMALFGIATLLGPVMGPAVGGLLTENLSWRWVFFINVPLGALIFSGLFLLMPRLPRRAEVHFDFLGFGLLAVFLAAFQLVLDRGTGEDWFSSTEIWTEAILAVVALWIFIFYSATTRRPFFDPRVLTERSFVASALVSVFLFVMVGSSLALMPPLLQNLLGYPVQTAGLLMTPRGLGTMFAMFLAGQLVNRIDPRLLVFGGLALCAFAAWQMTKFDLTMGKAPILLTGAVQGLGMGLLTVPVMTMAFATLPPSLRAEASSLYSVLRNLGQSAGISMMQAVLTRNGQVMHASLAGGVILSDPAVRAALPPSSLPTSAAGAMTLNAEIDRQAAMVAYVNDFKLMMIVALLGMPLLLIMRKPRLAAGTGGVGDIGH